MSCFTDIENKPDDWLVLDPLTVQKPIPKTGCDTNLIVQNYLSEFKTDAQKQKVKDNLGLYVDNILSKNSNNPISNKIVYEEFSKLKSHVKLNTIDWLNDSDMNNYVEEGTYNIKGNKTRQDDNLPIVNTGDINAQLTVIVTKSDNNIVITQVLNLNNNVGGEGNIYIRSCQNGEWKAWGKLQTNVEVGQVNTLDNLIDNGIYSGVLTDGTPTSAGTFYDTFVLIVINNYAVSIPTGNPQSISQLKYSLGLDGSISVASRKRDQYGFWTEWESLDEQSLVEEEKTRAQQAEADLEGIIDDEVRRATKAENELANAIIEESKATDVKIAKEKTAIVNGDTIVGRAREIHSRNGKTVSDSFLVRTTAGSGTIGDGVASLKSVGGNIVKNLLGQINSIAVNVKYDISLANANVVITAKDNYIGNSSSSTYIGIKTGKYFSGHKYYIAANCYSDVERKVSVAFGYNGYGGKMFYFPSIGAGEWTYVSKLVELNIENPVPYLSIFPFGHVNEYIQAGVLVFAGGINIIDLTEMFGAGKEPDQATCDRLFGTMNAMTQGLTIANPTEFKSIGFNLFNPENVLESKAVVDNAIVSGDMKIAIIPCLPCKVGTGENNGYCIHGDFGDDIKVYFTPLNPLDVDGELYMHELTKDATTDTYVPLIKGYLLVEVPTTANLCAHFLWSEDMCERDTYEPYFESKIELPIIPEMSDGLTGIVASGVMDTIDLEINKFTKRIGCVDLGSLTWIKMGATRFRTTGVNLNRVVNKVQLVCDKYTVLPTVRIKETYTNNTALKDVIFPVSFDNDINIMTSVEYASDADFKAAVSGVKLYYELPAYEEYPLPKVDNNYISSDYGVEQFNSVIPCNANNLYYMRSLAGETRNFLDRLMAGLGTSDATVVADRILALVNPTVEPANIEPEIPIEE